MLVDAKNRKYLVVAAHPDDEVLGCGGTMARINDLGGSVEVIILGEGATSRHDKREDADRTEVSSLKTATSAALEILGVKNHESSDLPDNRFDSLDLLDIVKVVEKTVERFKPDTVLTHSGGDLNIDHRRTFEAVLTACRPMNGTCVNSLYTFEIPSSTEWAFQKIEPAFTADCFIDVEKQMERKAKALGAYESEMRGFPHPRSIEAVQSISKRWGSVCGYTDAEAFQTIFTRN